MPLLGLHFPLGSIRMVEQLNQLFCGAFYHHITHSMTQSRLPGVVNASTNSALADDNGAWGDSGKFLYVAWDGNPPRPF